MKLLRVLVPALLMAFVLSCTASEDADASAAGQAASAVGEPVVFRNGALELQGLLYKPEGEGPFPAILYNHGSAAGMLNNQAFDAIAPIFVERGWVFFAPYRRGQGLSEGAGPYVMDEIAAARRRGGLSAADETMTRLLSEDHLDDQLAALTWLRAQPFVQPDSVAVMGNSFGGVETVFGAARGNYCAAVDAAGGSESWDDAPQLRLALTQAAQGAATPMLFFQAENDFNLAPSRVLHAAREQAGLPSELRIYPAFGASPREGHSFPYRGVSVWRGDVLEFVERHCRAM